MTDETATLRAALEHARAQHPELAALLDLHGEILAAQHAVRDALPELTGLGDRLALAEGQPALTFDELAVDWDLFARLWQQLDTLARRHYPDWPPESTPVTSPETVRQWFDGVLSADERVEFLIGAALYPFLARAATSVISHFQQDAWMRGICFVCGGEPDFAALERESGARRLFCSRCDTAWLFTRISCPFCGNADPGQIAYYPSADNVYRLYVCEACRRYLKTIDLRETARPFHVAVERIVTLGMDAAAQAEGYGQG